MFYGQNTMGRDKNGMKHLGSKIHKFDICKDGLKSPGQSPGQ